MDHAQPLAEPRQRWFRFLELLADDLSRNRIAFSTFSGATMKIRRALSGDAINVGKLARLVSAEPLLSAKLLRTANSAALNPGGHPIGDVKTAVMRVGYATVRSLAVVLALEQLQDSPATAGVRRQAETTWRHSVVVAAVAFVIASKLTVLSADEALFAGLVHDIGRFYLLSRASSDAELVADEIELEAVLQEWHASIGGAVLSALDVSDAVLTAVNDHELGHYSMPPRTMTDVVVLANLAAHALETGAGRTPLHEPELSKLLQDSEAQIRGLVLALTS